jgi:hypothetical protein
LGTVDLGGRGGFGGEAVSFPDEYDDAWTDRDVEVYAKALYDLEATLYECWHMKSYDPLTIEDSERGRVAHTYVFDLWDGGRHHPLEGKTNEELAKAMFDETLERIRSLEWQPAEREKK